MENILESTLLVLQVTPGYWSSLTERLPAELLTRAPAFQDWSALECLGHLVDSERLLFPVRLKAFLAGQDFAAFDPIKQGTPLERLSPPVDLARQFAELRLGSLFLLKDLTASDLERGVRHPELGPVTLGEMLHEWAAHDLMHTVQAERALMQPFIGASGAWRPSFADHDAGG